MHPDPSPDRDAGPTRRRLLWTLGGLGTVGALAGCTDTGSSAAGGPPDGGSDGTPTSTPVGEPMSAGGADGAAAFDCTRVPSSLSPFEAADVEFSFAVDTPSEPAYGVGTEEDPVQRVASFYFLRDGTGSTNDWDFHVDLSEFVDTTGDPSRVAPNATEVFTLDYDGTAVPVRHQAVTDDQDLWVLGLPQDGAFRVVSLSAAVMPGRFECHDAVRAVATAVVRSIRPR